MTEYVLDEQIGFLLRQVTQRHTTIFATVMGDGLTPMQWAVLAKLRQIGATSQTALGRAVSMDAATVKGTVDRLVARGLAARLRDEADRRKLMVDLTEAGRDMTLRNLGPAMAVSRETMAPLTAAEAKRLFALLGKLT
ncbi:MarR family winged helix-turn-helix transcriptional regulator [Acidisoma cladoniae]|jgi:DNA-binding MarR family transcriptional regulator|uniref:MarR family winged helix-turn-helix transcriptional regulator n=1 Tax=Acidisoma cladoniae TaxID=3040935 RepID=UPI002551B31A|nr:MarR family transcriptional regulator [Acidisoma sp. PAMC 29798]